MIIWFTGLPGSGKTTLANLLRQELEKLEFSVSQVDGDIFRKKEKIENKFSREDILQNNYRMISRCQRLQKNYDFIIVSAISPYEETRQKARDVFGEKYMEIFLDCPLEELMKRDPKNLFQRAIAGEIKNLIGFSPSSPYERPKKPELIINTADNDVKTSLEIIWEKITKKSS